MMKEIILVLGCLLVMAQSARMNFDDEVRAGRQYLVPAYLAPAQPRLSYGYNHSPSTYQEEDSYPLCEVKYETKCQKIPIKTCRTIPRLSYGYNHGPSTYQEEDRFQECNVKYETKCQKIPIETCHEVIRN